MQQAERRFGSKAMRIVDLTREITSGMPVYPGDPEIKITEVCTIDQDGYSVSKLELNDQVGTHVETQYHMIKRKKLGDEPLERFIGIAAVVDVVCGPIDISDLEPEKHLIQQADFLILRSGYSDRTNQIKIEDRVRPTLSLVATKWIVRQGIKLLGIDSFDFDGEEDYQGHLCLFDHNVLIVEGLTGLHQVHQRMVKLFVIPLKIAGVGGSPCRVFAIED